MRNPLSTRHVGSGMVDPVQSIPSPPAPVAESLVADDYRAVFVQHRGPLLRFAYLMGCTPDEVDDAVADAFTRAFAPWRRGDVLDVGAYLRRALVNQLRDGARKRRTHDRWSASVPAALVRDAAGRGAAESAEQRLADLAAVVRALGTLSDELRVTVVLRYYDDLTEAQTRSGARHTRGHREVAHRPRP